MSCRYIVLFQLVPSLVTRGSTGICRSVMKIAEFHDTLAELCNSCYLGGYPIRHIIAMVKMAWIFVQTLPL